MLTRTLASSPFSWSRAYLGLCLPDSHRMHLVLHEPCGWPREARRSHPDTGGVCGGTALAIGYHECRVIGGHSTARDLYKRSATAERYQYISHHGTVNNSLLDFAKGTYCLPRFPRWWNKITKTSIVSSFGQERHTTHCFNTLDSLLTIVY